MAQRNSGPVYTALGLSGVAMADAWAMQLNPAGMADIRKPVFVIAYEQHFLDQGLSTQSAFLVIPFSENVFGLSFEQYGFSTYKEQVSGFAYSRRFGNSISLAIGVRYHEVSIPTYGSSHTFSVEAGLQYALNEKFSIASHLYNPSGRRYRDQQGPVIPVRLSLGICYRFSTKVLGVADIRKSAGLSIDAGSGMEYALIEKFILRGGVSLYPFRQYAGFGLHYEKIRVDAAISSHTSLGYSPQISLGYEF